MAELGTGSGSDYPGTLDTNNTLEVNTPNAGKTKARAEVPNDHASAIIAIENELGTDPAGTTADVKTYLQTEHNLDGTHGTITTGTIITANITNLDVGSSTVVTGILDEDNMASDSATDLATQQSIKKYVDDNTGSGSVGQGDLQTSTGEVSTAATGNFTLPGGTYGFYPQVKTSGTSGNYQIGVTTGNTSYLTNINIAVFGGDTNYAQQRFVTASAPYNLGNGDIPLFSFAIIDNNTGKVIATYTSDTPPWFYNGRPENIFDARKYKKKKNKKNYFYDRLAPLPDKDIDFEAYLHAVENPQYEEIEITPAMKNLDMDIIPHPFISNNLTDKSVVLLDPVGSMAEKMRSLHDMGESIADLLHGGYLLIDNEDAGANSPQDVKTHKVKWK